MKLRGNNVFSTVRTYGVVLPADLLQRIALGDGYFDGLTPVAYHLLEGEKLNELRTYALYKYAVMCVSFEHQV